MSPTPDDYRALARSSPWLCRSLHLTRRDRRGAVEAWVRRPGQLWVRPEGGAPAYVTGAPYSVSRLSAVRGGTPPPAWPAVDEPVLRPDGLVLRRPADWHLEHGDPMWQDYTWTAALDPEELSHDVEVDDVRAVRHCGREAWRARLRPGQGYEPRCGCCPLLWSEVSVAGEYAGEPARMAAFADEGYPVAYDVTLDRATGVLVSLEPVGGFPERSIDIEIHDVDADVGDPFAGEA